MVDNLKRAILITLKVRGRGLFCNTHPPEDYAFRAIAELIYEGLCTEDEDSAGRFELVITRAGLEAIDK